MEDLLLATDPDWAAFNSGDTEFLLRSTGETIRSYCNWHIAPSITQVLDKVEIGSNGIIMLPTLHLTDVASITVQYSQQDEVQTLDPEKYTWHVEGYIEPVKSMYVSNWGYLPNTTGGLATVTFTHGYDALPSDIKRVAFELAGWVGEIPTSGDVKSVTSPGFNLTLGGHTSLGMNLNPDQRCRLSRYRIPGVK